MKILILGDIHGRPIWKDIISKESPDLTVFLGDYVSTHENIDTASQITNLEAILQYKESNLNSVILLRGNHDNQHLGYSWAECSGLFPGVLNYLTTHRDRFLSLTQWVYIKDNIIFSHAGISKKWMERYNIKSINDINDLEPSPIFGFTSSKMSDYTGISPTQSCTWIRPQALVDNAIDDYIQVVGHTPVSKIVDINKLFRQSGYFTASNSPIWVCDNLPNQYLIINDNEFVVIDYEK